MGGRKREIGGVGGVRDAEGRKIEGAGGRERFNRGRIGIKR